MSNEEKLTKVGINWYPRTHGKSQKGNKRKFEIN